MRNWEICTEPVLLAELGAVTAQGAVTAVSPNLPRAAVAAKSICELLGQHFQQPPLPFCVINVLMSESPTSLSISVETLAVLFRSALVFILRAFVVLGNEGIIVNIPSKWTLPGLIPLEAGR